MPNKFTFRSNLKELLDETDIPSGLLHKNLRELDILNRSTGGHAITLRGMKQLITNSDKTYQIVDLGCGSGDALKVIADWSRLNNYRVALTGVDMNLDAIDFLKINCAEYPEIKGVTSDYHEYLSKNKYIDIVHCSLFCHHLNNDELVRLFTYFKHYVKKGFIINDLQRHWLSYYSAWFFTRLFNGSVLAKNDGPISVLRSFKYEELVGLLKKANFESFSIKKVWFFRYLVVVKTRDYV